MITVAVSKSSVRLMPDPSRTITKPFAPGGGRPRLERILSRILAVSDAEVATTLSATEDRFAARHLDLRSTFETAFAGIAGHIAHAEELSAERRQLIGAYFTHEYSIESAALTNPSMVRAPDHEGLAPGAERFILSLRAIGEGHISSIEFRSGVIHAGGEIEMEASSRYRITGDRRSPIYDKRTFRIKLTELHALNETAAAVLASLPERFTLEELDLVIAKTDEQRADRPDLERTTRTIHWLASSNYVSAFAPESTISERVLFPSGPTESHGMEDARFVRFRNDDGSVIYYAPYTAYDGYEILPQLIATTDFMSFSIATLNGPCARNKGIALFPRKIGGRFFALARLDNENNFLIWSDNLHFWHQSQIIQTPESQWELIQLGNCGSPLETDAGWLVITHGVGAMRQYAIGAILLDKADPTRVIGHLREPLLEPSADERDGYVPNVVYSCGSMISGELLVLPYGFADVGARIATVRLADLLSKLTAAR